jgi:uncharacterized membrane protein YhaH (DUF805 family)
VNWYLAVLKNYVGFDGRARRQEYWMFTLVNLVIEVILYALGSISHSVIFTAINGLYGLALLLPGLAVFVRRMHDTGRSGWWFFLGFVPLVGAIILLVWLATDGNQGPNRYGPDPKRPEMGEFAGVYPQDPPYPQVGNQYPPRG